MTTVTASSDFTRRLDQTAEDTEAVLAKLLSDAPLPDETARPKRLRFQIFCSPGKLVSHARQTWLRVRRLREQLAEWIETLRHLPIPQHA